MNPQSRATGRRFARLGQANFTLLSIILFALVLISQPLSAVQAEDGLALNSPARVANTDGDGVRFREEASASASVISTIGENELVVIKGGLTKDKQGNSFYKISYDGKTGFVMAQYLIFAGKASPGLKALPVGSPAKIANTDGDGVNMRQQPSAGTPVLAVLTEGSLLTVLGGPFNDKQNNSFYRVDYKGQTGYVTLAYVVAAPRNTVTTGGGGFMKVTNTDGDPIRFRTGPSRSTDSTGYVYEGQVVKLLGGAVKDEAGNKWYRVEQAGNIGYVDAAFLARTEATAPTAAPAPAKTAAPAPAPAAPKAPAIQAPASNGPLGDRIVAYARQFLGWRYVWGGSSPAAGGFDCSGFVYWVMSQNGVAAGHSVEADLSIGRAVGLNALQPGDVLIWANTYKAGPSHAGIYIGGGKFIHAETEATGVTIDDMNESYYASRFYGARRPGV